MMNKIIITLIFLMTYTFVVGQNISKREKLERIKAQKVAFITNKLDLSSAEAQLFWPIYNEFFKEKEALNRKKTNVNKDLLLHRDEFSDEKKSALLDQIIQFKITEANMELKYHNKLKTVLPIDKLIKLYNAENQFKTFLLKQIKGNGSGNIRSQNRESRRR